MEVVAYLNFAGALAAFFLTARVVALGRNAIPTHRVSWTLLLIATAAFAALLAVDMFAGRGSGGFFWARTLLDSVLVALMIAGCFFFNVRERRRPKDLFDAAEIDSRRSRRLEAILDLDRRLRDVHTVADVARVAAGEVERAFAYRETALYLYDEDRDVFVTAASVGQHSEYDAVVSTEHIPPRVLLGVLRDEFRSGNCYFIDHTRYQWTSEELAYFPPGPIPDRGPGMFHADDAVFAPLYGHDGELLGMFDVYDPADGRLPTEDTMRMLEIFASVTASAIENAAYATELEQRSVTDGLTGLYNHRHFQERLLEEVERAGRYELGFTLLMMDLDLFKDVNDRLGHPRGDDALRAVGRVLLTNARVSDFVARYGGEEFVMILPGTSTGQAAVLAERVAQGVRDIELDVPEPPRLSISIGMASYPACSRDREGLIAAADAALMHAKRSGRDMIVDFSRVSL